jgi:hypothetical protein
MENVIPGMLYHREDAAKADLTEDKARLKKGKECGSIETHQPLSAMNERIWKDRILPASCLHAAIKQN